MDESPEVLREQIEQTKTDLTEKLETLEQQVSESVQTTGAAVSATVEAIQDTVESVNGAVHHAVESVGSLFDLRSQVDRHPLLMVGGAAFVGYVLSEYLAGGTRKARKPPQPASCPVPSTSSYETDLNSETFGPDGPAKAPETFVAREHDVPIPEPSAFSSEETGNQSSPWNQVGSMAAGALLGLIQTAAAHALPRLIDGLLGDRTAASQPHSNGHRPSASRTKLPPEEGLQRHRANGPDHLRHRRHD